MENIQNFKGNSKMQKNNNYVATRVAIKRNCFGQSIFETPCIIFIFCIICPGKIKIIDVAERFPKKCGSRDVDIYSIFYNHPVRNQIGSNIDIENIDRYRYFRYEVFIKRYSGICYIDSYIDICGRIYRYLVFTYVN